MNPHKRKRILTLLNRWGILNNQSTELLFRIFPQIEDTTAKQPEGKELIDLQIEDKRVQRQRSFVVSELISAISD